ncbi:MAG: ArgE/DapE family deacylase [Candidatus Latescibacterota bacterium]
MNAALTRALESGAPAAIELLADLVRIPTVNPPGCRYAELVALLDERCRGLGLTTKVHRVPDSRVAEVVGSADYPRLNLVARWDIGAPRTVHFNGHYDVVPASGSWRFGDPFCPEVSGGSLYGRGSGDMKGSIVALLAALAGLREAGLRPAVNVECSFTADEETGGELGAGYLVRESLIEADCVVVCEGAANTQVACGHNGVLWLEVEILGKAAHASRPEDGVNAFEQMAALVTGLGGYRKRLATPRRQYRDPSGTRRSPTVTLGGVFGGGPGEKVNTVPARASFSIDRRLVPSERLGPVETELRRALEMTAARTGARHRVRPLLRIAPCVVDPQAEVVRAFSRAVQSVRRRPVGHKVTTGFTDLHYFVEEAGLPGLGYGVKGEFAHGQDERIRVRDLLQTARIYAEFIASGMTCP